MIATIASATLLGIDGRPVFVEVHVSNGLPAFNVVGLPDAACRESRDRVRAALLSSDLPWPLRRITVNLAPSSVRKGGAGLDLPIAVGLLVALGELVPSVVEGYGFVGELGLDGSIRPVPGMVSLAEALHHQGPGGAGCRRGRGQAGGTPPGAQRDVPRPGGGLAARPVPVARPAA